MSMDITVNINGKEITVKRGTTILEAARNVNIHIPTLCYHDDLCISGICRICLVEVDGERTLQAACSIPITRPVTIKTHTERVRKARRNVLELMLANHYGECYTCFRNQNCELQKLAKEYGVDALKFEHVTEPRYEQDKTSAAVVRDKNKCILCRRCIRTCQDFQGVGALDATHRGYDTQIQAFYDQPMADAVCINCGQCITRCPVGALREKDFSDSVWQAIDDPSKIVVIQTAPAPRAAIGEEFGLPPGTSVTKKLNTALKMIGFDYVFDTNFTADLTIMEEGTELLGRLKDLLVDRKEAVLPMVTSCSPGWIKFCEHFYPKLLPNLSTCKSPQQMFGAILKTYFAQKAGINPANMVVVSLMPCVAKKFETDRPEMTSSGFKDVDFALTTREVAQMIKEAGIQLTQLEDSPFDDPLGLGSGAGLIFGATGGVMEAAIRTAYEIVTGEEAPFENLRVTPVRGMEGIKEAEIFIPKALEEWSFLEGKTLRVAVAHGTANARKLMDIVTQGIAQWHFIEVMACPGGCLGGGGQPIPTSEEIRKLRAKAIYGEDEQLTLRKSHKNPQVLKLYEEFLGTPNSHKSHELLHTTYTPRGVF
ncbi:MAG: NADH-dependent [FeFe] hydrogenase, group A6 [Candidatus Auribacterota bacterium]|jgi:NADH-quinone oxidoreductase subunit G/[NiFe] hydrogenase diaphorase moiety small subunit|nr:NADH-dependent [FeFe] hydrogenase, group A6 [Candidatus Auribacterota bacterium]